MVYRKRSTRKGTRRTRRKPSFIRKKRYVSKSSATVGKGFPSQIFVKLPYDDLYPGTTSSAFQFIRYQSSLYDPDHALLGHQPRYFDQWAAIYNKYQVFAMKYEIDIINTGTSAMASAISWDNYDTAGMPLNINDMMESKYSQSKTVGPVGGPCISRYRGYMKLKTILGQKKLLQEDTTQASITANPANMMYLNIGSQPLSGVNTPQYKIRLTYYARMFEPIIPGQS